MTLGARRHQRRRRAVRRATSGRHRDREARHARRPWSRVALFIDPGRSRRAAVAPAATRPLTFSTLFAGVTLTLFAYGGWQQALWMAGETIEAPRTVPRAILLGVGIVGRGLPVGELGVPGAARLRRRADGNGAHGRRASRSASPVLGRRIAAGAVAVSALGVLNAQFLTGPRLTWAMARDGPVLRAVRAPAPTLC